MAPLRPALVVAAAAALVFACAVLGEPISDVNPGRVGTDANGNVVVEPPNGKQVIIDGTVWNSVLERLDTLERAVGVSSSPDLGMPGLSVVGNDVYVSGKNVYLVSPKHTSIKETSTAWSPDVLSISVGDNVTWTWSSSEALYQVDPTDNVTAMGSINSGSATFGGSFSYTFMQPGTFRIRGVNKGFLTTVNVIGFGINADNVNDAAQFLQDGITDSLDGTEVMTGMAYEVSYSYSCVVTTCPSGMSAGFTNTRCVRCSSTPGALSLIYGFTYGGQSGSYYYWGCTNPDDRLVQLYTRSPTGSTGVDDFGCLNKV